MLRLRTSEQFPTENELTLAMDLMEHVRQPVVKGVRLMLNSQVPLEGSMCISAFYLIYSTRKQESADEITVSASGHYSNYIIMTSSHRSYTSP